MIARACTLLLFTDSSMALRRSAKKSESESGNMADAVACPVMGALVNSGVIKLDSKGRASQLDTLKGLMWSGNSDVMAAFQARGIAAFKNNDTYQEYRERGGNFAATDLYLNYNTWNPYAECTGSNPTLRDGMACNINIGFQQHGYSTTIRDPSDGSSAKRRWDRWMEQVPGVLTNIPGVRERVMTIQGLGALLKEQRLKGSKHGEFSLTDGNEFKGSPLAFYHPAASTPDKYTPVSQWQAIGAWAAFWALFEREAGGVTYMPESDLRRFFFDAKFPADWSPRPWGFKETFKAVRALRGTGAGEEWCAIISAVLDTVGEEGDEQQYGGGLLQALQTVGARDDDVFKRYPESTVRRRRMLR